VAAALGALEVSDGLESQPVIAANPKTTEALKNTFLKFIAVSLSK
jgi:hypothetical protein